MERIDTAEVVEKINEGTLDGKVLDIRNVTETNNGHVEGAELFNLNRIKNESLCHLNKD